MSSTIMTDKDMHLVWSALRNVYGDKLLAASVTILVHPTPVGSVALNPTEMTFKTLSMPLNAEKVKP